MDFVVGVDSVNADGWERFVVTADAWRFVSLGAYRSEFDPGPISSVPTQLLSRPFSVARSLMSHRPFSPTEGIKSHLALLGSGSGTEARGVGEHAPGGVPDVPP